MSGTVTSLFRGEEGAVRLATLAVRQTMADHDGPPVGYRVLEVKPPMTAGEAFFRIGYGFLVPGGAFELIGIVPGLRYNCYADALAALDAANRQG